MAIFKLITLDNNIDGAELVEATKTELELEKYLESWLERSPWAIAQEPLMWIGRQASAPLEDSIVFPDLLGVDKDGNLVVVEFKKGKAPREVVAQILEYASWACELSEDIIRKLSSLYYTKKCDCYDNFDQNFCKIFETDEVPRLNQRLRLFIIAEDISSTIARVCRFLRASHSVDINCIAVAIYKTEAGEILVSTETIVGLEDLVSKEPSRRWSGPEPVKQIVFNAVEELTKGNITYIFSPKEVAELILKKYPTFNKSTIGCQIISDCVNHNSRHHYPGGEDRYWWVSPGKYRLFDAETDKT